MSEGGFMVNAQLGCVYTVGYFSIGFILEAVVMCSLFSRGG